MSQLPNQKLTKLVLKNDVDIELEDHTLQFSVSTYKFSFTIRNGIVSPHFKKGYGWGDNLYGIAIPILWYIIGKAYLPENDDTKKMCVRHSWPIVASKSESFV